MTDAYKSLSTPSSGRGTVQTGMGRTGGPTPGAYRPPPGRTSAPADFALPAAVAGHNDPQQSIPRARPTQAQPRDNAMAYMAPKPEYTAASAGTAPKPAHETGLGRPGGPRAVGAYAMPMANEPSGGGVQTDHTGRQPYAGREPMMVPGGQPAPGVTADSETNPGVGGLVTGHDGPLARSGNTPQSYRPSDSSSAAEEGVAVRNMVRAIARGNGGVPADLESPGRARGPVGINPPGADRGQGYESHDGRGMSNA